MDAAQADRLAAGETLSPEQIEARREKENLMLSRKRLEHQLESCRNARHRRILEGALAFLNEKLAELGPR